MKNKEAKAKQIAEVFSTILNAMTIDDVKRVNEFYDKRVHAAYNLGNSSQLATIKELDTVLNDTVLSMSDYDIKRIVKVLQNCNLLIQSVDKVQ